MTQGTTHIHTTHTRTTTVSPFVSEAEQTGCQVGRGAATLGYIEGGREGWGGVGKEGGTGGRGGEGE